MIGPWLRFLTRRPGASAGRYPLLRRFGDVDVTGLAFPPLEGCMSQSPHAFRGRWESSVADHALGNSVGAIGWPVRPDHPLTGEV